MELNLNPTQIMIVGLIATLLASLITWFIQAAIPWFINKVWKKPIQIDLGRFVKTVIVSVTALLLAWWWYPVSLPGLPAFTGNLLSDIELLMVWIPVLLAALSPYLGSAVAIYNLILGYITDPERRKKAIQLLLDLLLPNIPRIDVGR